MSTASDCVSLLASSSADGPLFVSVLIVGVEDNAAVADVGLCGCDGGGFFRGERSLMLSQKDERKDREAGAMVWIICLHVMLESRTMYSMGAHVRRGVGGFMVAECTYPRVVTNIRKDTEGI